MTLNFEEEKAFNFRAQPFDSNMVDVHILGMHIEQNAPDKPPRSIKRENFYTFRFILKGAGYVKIFGEKTRLTANTLFVTFPDASMTHYPDPDDPWLISWIAMDGLNIKNYLKRIGITETSFIRELTHDDSLREIFQKGPYLIKSNPDASDVLSLKFFYDILAQIITAHALPDAFKTEKYDRNLRVADAIDFINNHYHDNNLRLTTVAKAVGVSSNYLSIIFRETTKISFSNFLQRKRLAIAQTMINQGNISVTDIAFHCGFSNPYNFSSLFKKYNSISPKHLILKLRSEKKSDEEHPFQP